MSIEYSPVTDSRRFLREELKSFPYDDRCEICSGRMYYHEWADLSYTGNVLRCSTQPPVGRERSEQDENNNSNLC